MTDPQSCTHDFPTRGNLASRECIVCLKEQLAMAEQTIGRLTVKLEQLQANGNDLFAKNMKLHALVNGPAVEVAQRPKLPLTRTCACGGPLFVYEAGQCRVCKEEWMGPEIVGDYMHVGRFHPVRHVKTGGLYVRTGLRIINATNGSADGQRMVLYVPLAKVEETDAFVREESEFNASGRFELVEE